MNNAFKYAILTIPASILLIVPVYTDPINLPKMLVLIPFTITSLIMAIALRDHKLRRENVRGRALVLLLYGLLLLAMTISGFLGSQNYIRVLFGASGRNNGLIYYLSAILLAIILLQIAMNASEISYLNKVVAWTSLVFSAYCLIQFLGLDPVSWQNPYNRILGTLGNPNFSASALSSFSAFWLNQFFFGDGRKFQTRIVSLFLSLAMLFLSWSTQSLQGLVVFVLGAGLIFIMYLRERWKSPIIPLMFFFFAGLSFLLLFAAFLGLGPLGSTLEQYTLKLRGWYALFGVKAMLNSPWYGVGVDNYVSAFRVFKSREFVTQYGSVLSSNNAHSTPVQIGATFGLFVFVIYCAIQFLILYKALSIINSRDLSHKNLRGIALIWILIFSQSLLSIEIIGLGVMNWILGAVILNMSFDRKSEFVNSRSNARESQKVGLIPIWSGPLAIASFCLTSLVAIPFSLQERAYQTLASIQISDEQSKGLAVQNFRKLDSLTLFYPEKLDRIIPNMFYAGLSADIEKVVKALYQIEPGNAYAADLLATYYNQTGQFSSEVNVREDLRNLDPWNEKLELALARAYFQMGDKTRLAASVKRIEELNPASAEYQQALAILQELSKVP